MHRLSLLRHAEAASASADKERPLTANGLRAMKSLGAHLTDRPDLVLCSPARRTRETLQALLPEGERPETRFLDKIYEATPGTLLELIKENGGDRRHILLVGHNPGIHGLAVILAERGDPALLQNLRLRFDPGTMAVLEFGEPLSGLLPASGELAAFIAP